MTQMGADGEEMICVDQRDQRAGQRISCPRMTRMGADGEEMICVDQRGQRAGQRRVARG